MEGQGKGSGAPLLPPNRVEPDAAQSLRRRRFYFLLAVVSAIAPMASYSIPRPHNGLPGVRQREAAVRLRVCNIIVVANQAAGASIVKHQFAVVGHVILHNGTLSPQNPHPFPLLLLHRLLLLRLPSSVDGATALTCSVACGTAGSLPSVIPLLRCRSLFSRSVSRPLLWGATILSPATRAACR